MLCPLKQYQDEISQATCKTCAVGQTTPDHPAGTAYLNTPEHKRDIITGCKWHSTAAHFLAGLCVVSVTH